jgi:hypothetical protein
MDNRNKKIIQINNKAVLGNPTEVIKHNSNSINYLFLLGGTRQRSWLRQHAKNRKVAGSIPNEVIKYFN